MTDDRRWMALALALGRRGLGQTWPNPAVGCVLVQEGQGGGRVVGRGWTQPGGRPHAEKVALAAAGAAARGATAYVTLEPCAHQGRDGPCTDALIAANIYRCVVAIGDPYPEVSGRGFDQLRAAGIALEIDVGADQAKFDQAGFLSRITTGRPLVTLKLAQSLDGRIATATGESQWITGDQARALGHLLRAEYDAIAVGIGTVLADDPRLDCRLAGLEHRSPVRVVFDSQGRLPGHAAMLGGAAPVWRLSLAHAPAPPTGAEAIGVAEGRGGLAPLAALEALAERGITRLLVEGGGQLAASLLAADLVDRLAVFTAPMTLGGDGVPAIGPLGLTSLEGAPRFRHIEHRALGADRYDLYARKEPACSQASSPTGVASPPSTGPAIAG